LSQDELLDWTWSEAPASGEAPPGGPRVPLPPPPAQPPRRPLPRWTWALLAAVVVLAGLVAAFGLPALERYRARRAVEAVVAQEAAASPMLPWGPLLAVLTSLILTVGIVVSALLVV